MKVEIGKGIELDVNVSRLGFPDESALSPVALHTIYIGVRNIAMDSHASVTADKYPDEALRVEAARAVAEKKLNAMYNGDLRTTVTRTGDPVKRKAIEFASDDIVAALKQKGQKATAKAIRERATALVAEKTRYMERARKYVEEIGAEDIDLGDMETE